MFCGIFPIIFFICMWFVSKYFLIFVKAILSFFSAILRNSAKSIDQSVAGKIVSFANRLQKKKKKKISVSHEKKRCKFCLTIGDKNIVNFRQSRKKVLISSNDRAKDQGFRQSAAIEESQNSHKDRRKKSWNLAKDRGKNCKFHEEEKKE